MKLKNIIKLNILFLYCGLNLVKINGMEESKPRLIEKEKFSLDSKEKLVNLIKHLKNDYEEKPGELDLIHCTKEQSDYFKNINNVHEEKMNNIIECFEEEVNLNDGLGKIIINQNNHIEEMMSQKSEMIEYLDTLDSNNNQLTQDNKKINDLNQKLTEDRFNLLIELQEEKTKNNQLALLIKQAKYTKASKKLTINNNVFQKSINPADHNMVSNKIDLSISMIGMLNNHPELKPKVDEFIDVKKKYNTCENDL